MYRSLLRSNPFAFILKLIYTLSTCLFTRGQASRRNGCERSRIVQEALQTTPLHLFLFGYSKIFPFFPLGFLPSCFFDSCCSTSAARVIFLQLTSACGHFGGFIRYLKNCYFRAETSSSSILCFSIPQPTRSSSGLKGFLVYSKFSLPLRLEGCSLLLPPKI